MLELHLALLVLCTRVLGFSLRTLYNDSVKGVARRLSNSTGTCHDHHGTAIPPLLQTSAPSLCLPAQAPERRQAMLWPRWRPRHAVLPAGPCGRGGGLRSQAFNAWPNAPQAPPPWEVQVFLGRRRPSTSPACAMQVGLSHDSTRAPSSGGIGLPERSPAQYWPNGCNAKRRCACSSDDEDEATTSTAAVLHL